MKVRLAQWPLTNSAGSESSSKLRTDEMNCRFELAEDLRGHSALSVQVAEFISKIVRLYRIGPESAVPSALCKSLELQLMNNNNNNVIMNIKTNIEMVEICLSALNVNPIGGFRYQQSKTWPTYCTPCTLTATRCFLLHNIYNKLNYHNKKTN